MNMKARAKKIFFISECLMNQNIRAYGVSNMKGEGPVKELIDVVSKNGYGFTVVSCPEIPYEGLKRFACGKERYDNKEYQALCKKMAKDVIHRYKLYRDDGYIVGGFICVNGSPSCGVDFCHRDGQRCNEKGVFIEELLKLMEVENICFPFIGFRAKEIDTICKTIQIICDSHINK